MSEKPIVDASGQWLNPGDVITHANRSGSAIWLDVGYITQILKGQYPTIVWSRVRERREWDGKEVKTWHEMAAPTKLQRVDLCTKTGMTIERLKSKYGIQEKEKELERPETEPMGTRFSIDHTPLPLEG